MTTTTSNCSLATSIDVLQKDHGPQAHMEAVKTLVLEFPYNNYNNENDQDDDTNLIPTTGSSELLVVLVTALIGSLQRPYNQYSEYYQYVIGLLDNVLRENLLETEFHHNVMEEKAHIVREILHVNGIRTILNYVLQQQHYDDDDDRDGREDRENDAIACFVFILNCFDALRRGNGNRASLIQLSETALPLVLDIMRLCMVGPDNENNNVKEDHSSSSSCSRSLSSSSSRTTTTTTTTMTSTTSTTSKTTSISTLYQFGCEILVQCFRKGYSFDTHVPKLVKVVLLGIGQGQDQQEQDDDSFGHENNYNHDHPSEEVHQATGRTVLNRYLGPEYANKLIGKTLNRTTKIHQHHPHRVVVDYGTIMKDDDQENKSGKYYHKTTPGDPVPYAYERPQVRRNRIAAAAAAAGGGNGPANQTTTMSKRSSPQAQ